MLANKRWMFESIIESTARGIMKPNDIKCVNILDHTVLDGGTYSISVFMQDGRNFYANGSREQAYDTLYKCMRKSRKGA